MLHFFFFLYIYIFLYILASFLFEVLDIAQKILLVDIFMIFDHKLKKMTDFQEKYFKCAKTSTLGAPK